MRSGYPTVCVLVGTLSLGSMPAHAVTLSTVSTDPGGGRSTNGTVVLDSSAGGIVGWCTNATPGRVMKVGYVGQLYDIVELGVTAVPTTVAERTTRQLEAMALYDDQTAGDLTESARWRVASGALAGIDTNGLATAATVYEDTTGTAEAEQDGATGDLVLLVLNTDWDDYGSYASDGLDDAWQIEHFGFDNPDAGPGADPDIDGGDNLYEWITCTQPTNPASLFLITRIEQVSGVSTQMDISFDPTCTDRTYAVLMRDALTSGAWTNLSSYVESTSGTERTVRHLDATNTPTFYGVEVTFAP